MKADDRSCRDRDGGDGGPDADAKDEARGANWVAYLDDAPDDVAEVRWKPPASEDPALETTCRSILSQSIAVEGLQLRNRKARSKN